MLNREAPLFTAALLQDCAAGGAHRTGWAPGGWREERPQLQTQPANHDLKKIPSTRSDRSSASRSRQADRV